MSRAWAEALLCSKTQRQVFVYSILALVLPSPKPPKAHNELIRTCGWSSGLAKPGQAESWGRSEPHYTRKKQLLASGFPSSEPPLSALLPTAPSLSMEAASFWKAAGASHPGQAALSSSRPLFEAAIQWFLTLAVHWNHLGGFFKK